MAADTCSTEAASSITETSAVIAGTLDDVSTTGGSYQWYYGPSPYFNSYATGWIAYGVGFGPFPNEFELSGLAPGTTYLYEFLLLDGSQGGVLSFTTLSAPPPPTYPPSAITGAALNVTPSSATLTGELYANNFDTTYTFEWGTTTTYGNSTPSMDGGTLAQYVPVSANLSGLVANTVYHFQLIATNTYGTSAGGDASFTTNPAGGLLAFL